MSLMRFLFLLLGFWCALDAAESGSLVIVGGGGIPEAVRKHFIELAGGKAARIAVLPQASSRPDRGQASVEMYSKLGAGEVYSVVMDDPNSSAQRHGHSHFGFCNGIHVRRKDGDLQGQAVGKSGFQVCLAG